MAMLLKQSTTVTITMGPALDKTDGVTEKTALSPTVNLSKNGAVFAARNSATAISHDTNGYYRVELNTTDTNTAGRLRAMFRDSTTHLPVWHDFMVVPAVVYDSLVAGTDTLEVDATLVEGVDATNQIRDAIVSDATRFAGGNIATLVTQTDTVESSLSTLTTRVPDVISLANINAEVDTALNTAIPGVPTADSINERIKAIDDKLPAGNLGDATAANQTTIINATDTVESSLSTLTTRIPDTISLANINAEVDTALNTAIPGTPTANSVNERLVAIDDKLPAGNIGDATAANQTTLLNRIGAFTGSGVNTVLGFFKALLSKTASNPSDVGGTFDPTTDSTEAIRDRGDAAWITGAGGDVWATALPGAYGAGTAGKIIGDNLNATVGSRAAETSVDTVEASLSTLTSRIPDTISLANINNEVDIALNTAIPGSPTADSINERVKAIDDKLPAGTIGDATATSQTTIINATDTVESVLGTVNTNVSAILDDTGTSGVVIAPNALTAAALATDAVNEIRDAIRSAAASGELASLPSLTTPTLEQMIQFVYQRLRGKYTVTATQEKMYKADGSTVLSTATVSDDTTTFTHNAGA